MLANPLPEKRRTSSLVQQRGFAFLLRLLIILLAQQSFPLLRQVVEPTPILKASSALAGFLLAPQPAQAQATTTLTVTPGDKQVTLNWSITVTPMAAWAYRQKKGTGSYGGWQSAGASTARSKTVTTRIMDKAKPDRA